MRKVKSIKEIEPFDIYDITVDIDHCFELSNGVIAHNSMFPKEIVSGGCVVHGTKVRTDTGPKQIQELQVGNLVATLEGFQKISAVWNPDTLEVGYPECYKITFEDGTSVICSENHKFWTGSTWIEANNLKVNDDLTVKSAEY